MYSVHRNYIYPNIHKEDTATAEQDILQSVYPYIGGQENVSRTIPRKGTLYLMLKDAGVVNLAAVNQVQNWNAVG